MSQDLKPIVKCISKSPPSYRVECGDEFLQRQANEFLRAIEIRALSWRTVRAYAFDLVALMRWLKHSEIADGGVMTLKMQVEPNREWATAKEDRPFGDWIP